jgi:hypothetical protein
MNRLATGHSGEEKNQREYYEYGSAHEGVCGETRAIPV